MLRFANQPRTTATGRPTRDGRDSVGEAIRVEIYDPATNKTVETDAEVTLSLGLGSTRGTLIGGTAQLAALTGDLSGAVQLGVVPFLVGDALKIAMAVIIAGRLRGRTLGRV